MAVPAFQTKVIKSRVVWGPFTSEEMLKIAETTLDHIKTRISNAQDIDDNAAKPLNRNYALKKTEGRRVAQGGARLYRGKPIRDWTLRGVTMRSLRVKRVSEDMATIGPMMELGYVIIRSRNKLDHMWGMSPSDMAAMYGAVHQALESHITIRFLPGQD
jgi:hypothetical protein